MNYFELFETPVRLKMNAPDLPKRYFELSRKYHPDRFGNASEEEQAASLEKSALLNKAFQTFKDPDATIRYVLQLKGLMEEEEKYELPPDFLMEVLGINEAIMEGETEQVADSISRLEKEMEQPALSIIENYLDGITGTDDLLEVKAYYYKKKYLDRIREQVQNGSGRL